LKVLIPVAHSNAVAYTFNCLFEEFLGVEIEIIQSNLNVDFQVKSGDKSVTIKNIFFKTENLQNLYSKKNLPTEVDKGSIKVGGRSHPLVSLYGTCGMVFKDPDSIELHTDIIGSTFFMLTRWEEAVLLDRDIHDRFDYRSALSVKKGFYQRAIVNEYLELLWELCRFLKPNINRLERSYSATFTSDIDELRKWKNPKRLFESIYLHTRSGKLKRIKKDLSNYLISIKTPEKDYYNNLGYLTSKAEGIKTVFYLKTQYSHPRHDKNRYNLNDYALEINNALLAGIEIGIHPNYHTHDDAGALQEDMGKLEFFLQTSVTKVRQHYLRFSVPETWKFQAESGLKEDSTLIYPHAGGFRNGVCYPFPVFDFKSNSKLDIYEAPLILMETSYLESGFDHLLEDARELLRVVREFRGNFIFLWHNGHLVYDDERKYFESLVKLISAE